MKENGFILLARSIQSSDVWFKPPEYLKVWIHFLLNVNFEDDKLCKRGQGHFNLAFMAEKLDIELHTIYNCVKWLKCTRQITTVKTRHGLLVNVLQYDKYQDIASSNYQTKNQNKNYQVTRPYTLYKELKNNIIEEEVKIEEKVEEKKTSEKNIIVDEVISFYQKNIYPNSKATDNAKKKIATRLKSYSKDELIRAMICFAGNVWRMKYNANKGMVWFFRSDEQIEVFFHLEQDTLPLQKATTNIQGVRLAPNGKPLYIPTGLI